MQNVNIPFPYNYQGSTNSGSEVLGSVGFPTNSLSCDDIQIALQNVKAPLAYPLECNFITLSGTGVVFFMDPVTQTLVQGLEVSVQQSTIGFSEDDIIFLYSIETGFLIVLILMYTMYRNLRKISPYLFK